MKKRISLLILFVAAIAVLQRSSPMITVFTQEPKATAHWHVASPDNHLGGLIKATLRITTQKGVTVDLSRLPEAGDTLALPSKYDVLGSPYPGHESWKETSEGEVEAVSRRISQYNSVGGSIVTEVSYEFQYLLPIDFASSRDDKRLPSILPLRQEYLLAKAGKIIQRSNVILVEEAIFYIVPRVDENSQPIFRQFSLTPPATHWPYVRLVGFGLITSALCLLAWLGARFVSARRRRGQAQVEIVPNASALYELWHKNQDRGVFIEALKLYRRGVWGRPSATAWIKTTFILYSGMKLGSDQMEPIFRELVEEVSHDHSS